MTTDEKVRVLERMRELLADPDRVVLDPAHMFETKGGQERTYPGRTAYRYRNTCRVCVCGAATLAAFEVTRNDHWTTDNDAREVLATKARELGVSLDKRVSSEFGFGEVGILTSALKQGRAVEVVDAVLADLREGATA